MAYPDDVKMLRLEQSEYLIPTADAPILESLLRGRRPPVDYSVKPLPPPQDPLAAERTAEIEDAVSSMPYDDGDALPEGSYTFDKGALRRTGPAQAKVVWHGTAAPTDTAIDLEPRAPTVDGREHLRGVPAIYASEPLIAQDVAFDRWRRERDRGRGNEQSPQLYQAVVTPSETAELGDCTDADAVETAIESGADTVECPDWITPGGKAVPETIVLNEDALHAARALQIDQIPGMDVSETLEKTEQALRSDKRIGPSVRRPRGMPRFTRFKHLPANPRKRKANKRHPILRNGR